MSHFTVLVIGENWEDQLAPHSEQLEVEPYKDYCDLGSDGWPGSALAKDHPDLDRTDLALVAETLSEKWGERYEADDLGVYQWSTYNPRSKWDWYAVGGRWAGFFPLKEGGSGPPPNVRVNQFSPELARQEREHFAPVMDGRHTDQARKRDIDFEAKALDAGLTAGEEWDQYDALLKEHGPRPDVGRGNSTRTTSRPAAPATGHSRSSTPSSKPAWLVPMASCRPVRRTSCTPCGGPT